MGENRIHTGTATVVKNTGSHYLLSELPQWKPLKAVVRGRLRLSGSTATNPVAVGDRVEYSVQVDAAGEPVDEGTITKVLPRKNYIIRKSTNLSRQCHILASNIDTAYLIVTLDCPDTKWPFIDRFLVTCEAYKVPVTILLNKTDLYVTEELQAKSELFHSIYTDAGYPPHNGDFRPHRSGRGHPPGAVQPRRHLPLQRRVRGGQVLPYQGH